MITINLIGGGRVAQTLGRLLAQGGCHQVQDVLTRHLASANACVDFIGSGRPVTDLAAMRPAALWMLAVPDGQISSVATALAGMPVAQTASLAFHCSGALPAAELTSLRKWGWDIASAHCLLSFAQPSSALAQFPGTLCALEGDNSARTQLHTLFCKLGAHCFDVASCDKLLYHAGAVFATNFLPVLQDLAEQLWQRSNMPPALAEKMRERLLNNAVSNIVQLGPKAALTGPAARGDAALVARQAQEVSQWNANAGAAYSALSELAAQLAKRVPS